MTRLHRFEPFAALVLAAALTGCATIGSPKPADGPDWSGDLRMPLATPLDPSKVQPVSLDTRDPEKVIAALALDPAIASDIADRIVGVRPSLDGGTLELFEAPKSTAYAGLCEMAVDHLDNGGDTASSGQVRTITPVALRPGLVFHYEPGRAGSCRTVRPEEFLTSGPSAAIVYRALNQVESAAKLARRGKLGSQIPLFGATTVPGAAANLEWARPSMAIAATSYNCRDELEGLGDNKCWVVRYLLKPAPPLETASVVVAGRNPIAGVAIRTP